MLYSKLHIKEGPCRKFEPNYNGPYIVVKAVSGGALLSSEMDWDPLPKPVDSVKYFVCAISQLLVKMKLEHFPLPIRAIKNIFFFICFPYF